MLTGNKQMTGCHRMMLVKEAAFWSCDPVPVGVKDLLGAAERYKVLSFPSH